MKVNDYVRTKNGIERITDIKEWVNFQGYEKIITTDKNQYKTLYEQCEIIKSSPNIKKLIEAGDFITYKYINTYWLIPTSVYANYKENETTLMVDDYTLNEIEILSIVTKEQFESMEYKINE